MELKHTIQILTKDIQDIENVIRNLNNYTSPPLIELDLAMSKLRRVYELLAMISSDIKSDGNMPDPAGIPEEKQEEQIREETVVKKEVEKAIETRPEAPEKPEHTTVQTNEQEMPSASGISQPAEVISPENEVPEPPADKQAEPAPEPVTPEPESKKKQKEPTILAEKFESDKSLNEKIAHGMNSDVSSKIKGGPIDSIKRNIGINDRFLIIRELMHGDNEGFNNLVQNLDDCANFNDAFKIIESRFADNLEHDSVKILIDLSRRKFISSRNV